MTATKQAAHQHSALQWSSYGKKPDRLPYRLVAVYIIALSVKFVIGVEISALFSCWSLIWAAGHAVGGNIGSCSIVIIGT
ncbi:hypothetical protein BKA65DRAFT_137543 [Rhexocercosporidium sp. MPI-PUGE-AT-0058]|nr:hypothetical protein BKA65DRAFT_137543 [Rhexocercosporidium sp. MPI-PUGE-AT-0058]